MLCHLLDACGDVQLRRDAVLVGEPDGLLDECVGLLWTRQGRRPRGLPDGVRNRHEGGELGDEVRVELAMGKSPSGMNSPDPYP